MEAAAGSWDHSAASYGSEYLVFVVCLLALLPCWYRDGRFSEAQPQADAEARYLERHGILGLIDECAALLAWEQPEDPLARLEEYVRARRQRERQRQCVRHTVKRLQSGDARPGGLLPGLWRLLGGPSTRSVHGQFLLFAVAQGVSGLLTGVARHRLALYDAGGRAAGVRWGAENSDWLYLWILAAVSVPVATSSAVGVALTFALYPDWTVHAAHGFGLLAGMAEVALVIAEELERSGQVGQGFAVAALSLAVLGLSRHVAQRRRGLAAGWGALLAGCAALLAGAAVGTAQAAVDCSGACGWGCLAQGSQVAPRLLQALAVCLLFFATQRRGRTDLGELWRCQGRETVETDIALPFKPIATTTPVQPFTD